MEDERKAALIAEAKQLKAAIDPNWTVEQIEKVIARKRPVAAKAAPAPAPEAAAEGDDGDAAEAAYMAERNELMAAKTSLTARVSELEAANTKLAEKLAVSNASLFDLEAEKSKVDTELFDLRLKAAGGTENATPTEDFGGPKEAVAKLRSVKANGTVTCKVTKAGDGQIFTGNPGEFFKRNDMCEFPADTAATLEAKGWVETD
jgi:hypothetical protein